MIRQLLFATSALLAIVGTASSIGGILGESFKAISVGIVLIFAAGVFATLYLGSRNLPQPP